MARDIKSKVCLVLAFVLLFGIVCVPISSTFANEVTYDLVLENVNATTSDGYYTLVFTDSRIKSYMLAELYNFNYTFGGGGYSYDKSQVTISYTVIDGKCTVKFKVGSTNVYVSDLGSTTPLSIRFTDTRPCATFNLDGGTLVSGEAIQRGALSGFTPIAPTVNKDGYSFLGWSIPITNITSNTTYTALWQKQVNVTFNAVGGVRVGGGELVQTFDMGLSAELPIVARKGHKFLCWSQDTSSVQEDMQVIAKWKKIQETTSFLQKIIDWFNNLFTKIKNIIGVN